jgi:hypothetical protein
MPRIAKFDLVGNLPLNNLQAKTNTFKETCLCQIRSVAASKESGGWEVSN